MGCAPAVEIRLLGGRVGGDNVIDLRLECPDCGAGRPPEGRGNGRRFAAATIGIANGAVDGAEGGKEAAIAGECDSDGMTPIAEFIWALSFETGLSKNRTMTVKAGVSELILNRESSKMKQATQTFDVSARL